MIEFEDMRDEVEELYVKALRRHLVGQGLLPRSTFTQRDLGIKVEREVYSGYDHGATECEIQKRVDQVASEVESRCNWKEKLAWEYLRKLSRQTYLGWLKLRRRIGEPNECPKISTWNFEDINTIIRMINPMGLISIREGLYRINEPVIVADGYRVSIEGMGYGTIMRTDTPTTDVFLVKSDHALIRNMIVTCKEEVTKTDGAAVNVNFIPKGLTSYPMKTTVRDMWIDKQFYGLRFQGYDGTGDITVDKVEVYYPRYVGVSFELGSASGEVYVRRLMCVTPAGAQPFAGVRIRGGGGWYFTDVDIIKCGRGFLIDPTANYAVDWGFYKGLLADSGDNMGIWLRADEENAKIRGHTFTNCWASSGYLDGVLLEAGVGAIEAISFVALKSVYNRGNGALLMTPKTGGVLDGTSFYLCYALNNSIKGSGQAHGLAVQAGVCDFDVLGGKFGNLASFPAYQGYGILIDAGASDRYTIAFANLRGNVLGALSDGGTGLDKKIRYNRGYLTENWGVATFSGDGSTVAFYIAHGLVKTPTNAVVMAESVDARGDKHISRYADTIGVDFAVAPPVGTNNVVLGWRGEV